MFSSCVSTLDVQCWMFDVLFLRFDVGCSMLDVRCSLPAFQRWMFNVGCSMFVFLRFDVGCSMFSFPYSMAVPRPSAPNGLPDGRSSLPLRDSERVVYDKRAV